MKEICNKCYGEFETKWNDGQMIIFSHGKGKLCKTCYEYYDLAIKNVEYEFNILRGFKGMAE